MNVLYEDPPLEEENLLDASPLAVPKKPSQPSGGLPYDQIAKAITEATVSFKQQVEAFALLEASITEN
ncbi:hypothetical protein KC19_4G038700 [Ceratodon purpureus]|uniref:Uncharacterized protein n=1 Tax=Ceratodon purpureus TaxID=3225 RepID=A0A8T0I898_CERPU|nr:hypothetical protein KC19_4G038700 [Ceratodon purpureus]